MLVTTPSVSVAVAAAVTAPPGGETTTLVIPPIPVRVGNTIDVNLPFVNPREVTFNSCGWNA